MADTGFDPGRIDGDAAERFVEALVAWLNRRLEGRGVTVDADTYLFARGVVDSLGVLELIAWTEEAIGAVIPDEMIVLEHFLTPRRIARTFVEVEGVAR